MIVFLQYFGPIIRVSTQY